MKRLFRFSLCLALFGSALLTGCVLLSVCPFYTAKDVLFDPGLVGDWDNPTEADQHWKFEQQGEKSYRLTYTEKKKVCQIEANLFRLEGERFLDLFGGTEEDARFPPPIPSHTLVRVLQPPPDLRIAVINFGWFQKLLQSDPKALRHHLLKTGDKPEDQIPVLTAETEELQRFLIKYLKTAEAWSDPIRLQRSPAKP